MKAIWNNKVIAESDETVIIEGNHYFPPQSIKTEYFTDSDTHTTCSWKGEASYRNVIVDGEMNQDASWYYPLPKDGSVDTVGNDFSNYVAFWNGVEVVE